MVVELRGMSRGLLLLWRDVDEVELKELFPRAYKCLDQK